VLSTTALRLGVLLQNVDRMRSRVNQIAVNTHEGDEAKLPEVSVSFVQTEHGHVLDLADDVLLQVAEQHRGRIRCGNRRRHRLIDDVGVAENRIRCVHRQAGHPNGGSQAVPSETTFRRSFSAEQVLDLQWMGTRSRQRLWRQGLSLRAGRGKR
jgi:hypothetical protein